MITSGQFLNFDYGTLKNGTAVRVWPQDGSDEQLWDIAKDYRVREEDILKQNDAVDFKPGIPLLIMSHSNDKAYEESYENQS